MSALTYNPFITYLNRYTTTSPEHEAAFDEFISQTAPPSGVMLRLCTKTEQFVRACFQREHPPTIILTGNAGDGKTYLCRQIIKSFTNQIVTDWGDQTVWPIECDGMRLHVVKDLSELGREAGAAVLRELAAELEREKPKVVFLIAANEGRLRDLLGHEGLSELRQQVESQLTYGPDVNEPSLIVLNLNRVTTSSYVSPTLHWLTDDAHWRDCTGCSALAICPIRFNRDRLADVAIADRLQLLYQILEYLDIHVTIRDMLIHLAYTITGGLTCDEIVAQSRHLGREIHQYVYYENVWGGQAEDIFRRKVVALRALHRLNVGGHSLFEIDDFIINGCPDDPEAQAEYERLFAPAVDLGDRLFIQDRDIYLRGGAASPGSEEDHPFLSWLPHCRRKLFFEWENSSQANRLVSFLFLPQYLQLLEGDPSMRDRALHSLVLGLNRAFSGLYITETGHLYVTSQYAHAVEQPVPIVRFKLPVDYIYLTVQEVQIEAYDCDRCDLRLEISPPPHVPGGPVVWQVDLLRFEYLMRLAGGGTYNVLADECELVIRQLKDELLTRFVQDEDTGKIEFFAAERNRYILKVLWLDEEGKMRV
jgi:hypothetical protein